MNHESTPNDPPPCPVCGKYPILDEVSMVDGPSYVYRCPNGHLGMQGFQFAKRPEDAMAIYRAAVDKYCTPQPSKSESKLSREAVEYVRFMVEVSESKGQSHSEDEITKATQQAIDRGVMDFLWFVVQFAATGIKAGALQPRGGMVKAKKKESGIILPPGFKR